MTILIGCSGWSYDDWVGRFYPNELAKKRGEWFSYYAKYFRTVEINSTFYRPPGELLVQSWINKAQGREGFEYSLKVPQLVTHESLVDGNVDKAVFWARSFEKTCIEPLDEAGCLGGVLLQLSPYFKNVGPALDDLIRLLDSVSREGIDYAVEFRHSSWLAESSGSGYRKRGLSGTNDAIVDASRSRSECTPTAAGRNEIDPVVLDALRDRNVANVLLDGPGLQESTKQTADHAYIRFHGRNYDIWYKGEKEREPDHRLNRYDYLYQKEQLDSWVPRIREAELKAAKVRVYFNNHARAKSVRNAFLLMDLLCIEHPAKEIRLQDQFTLGEFSGRD